MGKSKVKITVHYTGGVFRDFVGEAENLEEAKLLAGKHMQGSADSIEMHFAGVNYVRENARDRAAGTYKFGDWEVE